MIGWIVTGFGAGLSPKAPGTMGTLVAVPLAWLMLFKGATWMLALAAFVTFFIGWIASSLYMRARSRTDDPQEIVIDEIAGYFATLAFMPILYLNPSAESLYVLLIAAFLAFRFFDIVKPWPVSLADRRVGGAFGVMLDDLLAAIYAALLLGGLGHVLVALGWIKVTVSHV